ncbi:hypothetical protein Pcac1_g28706 [Phytophthora cactorum]|nr:hypothetical protein Pcac1_g28706 [Phytophthora cactorum]
MGYLHFSNHKSPQARTDRAWDIRPVVDVLQRTFTRVSQHNRFKLRKSNPPVTIAYNPTRQLKKDKPSMGDDGFVAVCYDRVLHEARVGGYRGKLKLATIDFR